MFSVYLLYSFHSQLSCLSFTQTRKDVKKWTMLRSGLIPHQGGVYSPWGWWSTWTGSSEKWLWPQDCQYSSSMGQCLQTHGVKFEFVVYRDRSWTQWFLGVPPNSGHTMILWLGGFVRLRFQEWAQFQDFRPSWMDGNESLKLISYSDTWDFTKMR